MSFTTTDLLSTVEISEQNGDGSLVREDERVSWRFNITGVDDASTAYVALMSWLADNFSDGQGGIASYNLPLSTVRIETTGAAGFYKAEVIFEYPNVGADGVREREKINNPSYELPEIEDCDYQFSTVGGTSHITHSLETLAYPATGETARDFNGGIGFNPDGGFDGVDVVTPKVQFSISVSLPKAFVNATYRNTIAAATGSINSTAWNGYAAGNVLFRGFTARPTWFSYVNASGIEVRDWYWRATYNFDASPSTSITFGGETFVKRGFDYVWRLSDSTENATTGELESSVVQVNLERVYPEFDFALLDLPLPEDDDDEEGGNGDAE